jgi:predicted nucleic acid-binding protein
MPLLKYLVDTNVISDWMDGVEPVVKWLAAHSLIGAIARTMSAKVVTRNARHFPGCDTVNPWTGKESVAWRPCK